MSLYADDVMLYQIILSQVDFLALQIDIDIQDTMELGSHVQVNCVKILKEQQYVVP